MLAESLAVTMRIVCKWPGETFGTNGVILMLFGLAAGDRLGVGLGALGETGARTLGGNVLVIVSFNRT